MWIWNRLSNRVPGLCQVEVHRDSCHEGCIYRGPSRAEPAGGGVARCRANHQARRSSAKRLRYPKAPDKAELERVANPHADTHYVARFTAPEFTSLCPVTGQPDFAHLVIDYVPAKWLLEIKVAEALPRVVSQSRRISRGLHGRDRQARREPHRAALPADRRLLVSARRHSDRRLLADGKAAERRLAARSRCGALQRAGLSRPPSPLMRRRFECRPDAAHHHHSGQCR